MQTVQWIAAVCFKMAPKDLTRARRIADTRISPDVPAYGPYTLGLMAQAIAATDKVGASRLINDAYRGLEDLAAGEQPLAAMGPSMWQRDCSRSSSRWNRSDCLSSWVGRLR